MMGAAAFMGALFALTVLTAINIVPRSGSGSCQPDNEGSWSIGLFKGESPLNLTPVERLQPRVEGPAAWPVANPILTCASVTDPPSNFVADPFLWRQPGGKWYLFFETKTNTNRQGDIGVAESSDGGASWRYLGLALDEPWHLSYPFAFEFKGQVYLLPEGYGSGALRLYRAVEFPLKWELDRVLVDRPLIDTSLVEWEGRWWMFTSDVKRQGATKNGELEIYYADTPLGPWQPHALNPVMNGDRRAGARMAGRVVPFEGKLLRFGQDCGATYGHKVVVYCIDVLTPSDFQQTRVPFEFGQSRQGSAAWNGMRAHHVDVQQLEDGCWLAVMDGDWQPSGPISTRLKRAAALLGVLWAAVLGTACAAHLRRGGGLKLALQCAPSRPHWLLKAWARARLELRHACTLAGLACRQGSSSNSSRRLHVGGLKPSPPCSRRGSPTLGGGGSAGMPTCAFCRAGKSALSRWEAVGYRVGLQPGSGASLLAGMAVLALAVAAAAGLLAGAVAAWYYLSIWWDRPTAAEALAVEGQLSKFTLVVMSYTARLPTLRLFVQHYSRCPSVAEILLVWNRGPPPDMKSDLLGSLVPIRLRVEKENSLNNRFRPDPLIRTRAVLQLDDDILMMCSDIERGFAAWRSQPHALVGFYPRFITTVPGPAYLGEGEVFSRSAFNTVLTGAAFMDAERAFSLYWGSANAAAGGRAVVDRHFNCEDLLMNFLLASNQSASPLESGQGPSAGQPAPDQNQAAGLRQLLGSARPHPKTPAPVVYVRPHRRLDISKLSKVGISRKSDAHAAKREACIAEFSRLFGGNPLRQQRLQWNAGEGPPACSVPALGCIYL